MNRLVVRRLINSTVLVVFVLAVFVLNVRETTSLRHANFFSGWVLFTCIVALTGFNFRKKLPFLNMGSATAWLQLHIYLGFFTVAVFLMHIEFKVPNGAMECVLAILYSLVAGSGIVGLWLSRKLPPQLSRRGEKILYERIPAIRARLQEEVEHLALSGVSQAGSRTVADLYASVLFPFMSGARNFWFHCFASDRPYHKIRDKMQGLNRYLNEQEKEIMSKIAHRVRLKNDLDYQYTGQTLLKSWLFIHIPLTYGLVVFTVFHVVVAYAFIGGI